MSTTKRQNIALKNSLSAGTGSGRPTGNGLRPIRPTPSILDQIPRDDLDNEDISVVEGTFSSPPVVIPVQTGKQNYKILIIIHYNLVLIILH